MGLEDYPIEATPLPIEEGGGYLVTIPDLPGCIADGSTIEAAIAEARDAFAAWATAEMTDRGRLPEPTMAPAPLPPSATTGSSASAGDR